jgi:hypothetical protein
MSWQELTAHTAVVCLVLTGSIFAYVWALIQIGRTFGKIGRLLLGTLVYLLQAALVGGSFVLILMSAEHTGPTYLTGTTFIVAALGSWFCALMPGLLYLRSRMQLLRQYGFFLPRS